MITQTVLLIIALVMSLLTLITLINYILDIIVIMMNKGGDSSTGGIVLYGIISSIAWGLFYYYSHLI